MAYEEDFVSNQEVEAKIDGRKFTLKILLGEDYDRISTEFITVTPEQTIKIDIAKRNSAFLREAVVDAPYEQKGKKFKELSPNERLDLLQKLNPSMRNKLLKKIHEIHELDSDVKKN